MTAKTKALESAVAFHFEETEEGIGVLTFDIPDQKVNTFGQPVVEELGRCIEELEGKNLRGLLFRSGKPGQSNMPLLLARINCRDGRVTSRELSPSRSRSRMARR